MAETELVREIMDNFRRIVQAMRTSHRAAEHMKLTGAQLFVLSVLDEAPGPCSISDVAREAQTDPSTASVVVGRLVDAGYVRRERATDDSRRAELSLTARGRALLRKVPVTAPQRKLAKALQQLRASDARTLGRLLDRLARDMGLANEPAPMMFDEDRPRPRRSR
ncbi:MAG TPA: MarR family transcriptional regulator [Thermoanaerobaculia bacterium]|nr:MarR family transcriptional regulator [Thermoanaerobaculia bacterium]